MYSFYSFCLIGLSLDSSFQKILCSHAPCVLKGIFAYSVFLKDILSEGCESVHILQQPDSTSVWTCHSASAMHTQPYMVMMLWTEQQLDEKQEERHEMCNLVRLHLKLGVSVKAMEVTNCGGRQKLFYTCALECFASLQAKECVRGHKDKLRHYSARCSAKRDLSSWLLVDFKPVKSSVATYLMSCDLITQQAF